MGLMYVEVATVEQKGMDLRLWRLELGRLGLGLEGLGPCSGEAQAQGLAWAQAWA